MPLISAAPLVLWLDAVVSLCRVQPKNSNPIGNDVKENYLKDFMTSIC